MATYFIGDIQGCYSELRAILDKANFVPDKDELWLTGDLVARGPESLETLRYIKSLKKSAKVVLGNHDLHLMAIHAGLKKAKPQDKLHELLHAPDIEKLINWLAKQPLIRQLPNEKVFMSHAGISPQWKLKEALKYGKWAHELIKSPQRNKWLALMYGELPNDWQLAQSKEEKFRYTINAFTRMRFCYENKRLEFNCKSAPNKQPDNIKPWYELSKTVNKNTWIFGHWAALMGDCSHPNVYALDTGCVWGNHLTMLRWEDKAVFTENKHR